MKLLKPTALVLLAGVFLSGCASTRQAGHVEYRGFLDDYTIMQKGTEDSDPLFYYVAPNVDWDQYDKIMIAPVTQIIEPGSNTENIDAKQKQVLKRNFHAAISSQASNHFQIVQDRQAGVLKLEIALTDIEESNVTMDTVSNALPLTIIASLAAQQISSEATFAGSASIEAKVTDSATGQLLWAGVDRRQGGIRPGGGISEGFDSLSDAQEIMNYWSKLIVYQLCSKQNRSECIAPEA